MKIAGLIAGNRALAWLVMAGAGVVSLVAGWAAGALLNPADAPAKAVAMRFPAQWTDIPHSPPPAEVAEAPAAEPPQWLTFTNPQTTYATASAMWAADPAATPPVVAADGPTLAAADSETADIAPAAQTRMRVASIGPVPVPQSKPRVTAVKPDPRKGHVFNDTQIVSIKKRLALTPDQEQYWPTIEGALREVKWKKGEKRGTQSGHQMAQVDTSRVDMERLKSIAVPLVMSFREDQKRELRSLAHLMGLEEVASSF